MKTPVIRLIDLGLDDHFGRSMGFAQSLLSSMNVGAVHSHSDVEYLRTANVYLAAHALTVPARLIHIMSHGGQEADGSPGFGGTGPDGKHGVWLSLDELAAYLQDSGEGIEATAVFADACKSAQGKFVKAIQGTLEYDIMYIGATKAIDWRESTTFAAILYGAVLSAKGKGVDKLAWVQGAAERAVESYQTAVGGSCPFKVARLTPNKAAKAAFKHHQPGEGLH